MSILTGKDSAPRARKPAPTPEPDAGDEAMKAAMDLLRGQLERMTAAVQAAQADAAAARAEAVAERAKTEALRAQLMEEAEACSEAERALAGEMAVSEGLRAQLATERDTKAALHARLEQAIAAAGAKQPINIPAYVPPAYELEVVGRDVNERAKRIVLKPIKAEG